MSDDGAACAFCGHERGAHNSKTMRDGRLMHDGSCCELVWSQAHNDFVTCTCVRWEEPGPEAHGVRRG